VKDSENPICQPTPFLQQRRTVKTLAASLHHFYNSENPCCQPTPFLQQRRTVKTLAASLHHFTRFIAHFIPLPPAYTILHQWRTLNPCCQPTPFYTVYCPIIYLDLSIRLKKVFGFLSFSHWKLRVFLRFSHGFFPTASRTYANDTHRNLPQSAHKRCLLSVKSVFINRYTASLYRISTATKL
jgi:hypothetical protein